MSNFFDKVHSALENDLTESELVNFWNVVQEQSHYEPLYSMSEFNDIVARDKSYQEVKKSLGKDFDENAPYFRFDGYGIVQSVNNYLDAINLDELTEFVINDFSNASYPSEIAVLINGEAFEEEMLDVMDELSSEEIDAMISIMNSNGFEVDDVNDLVDALGNVIRDGDPCNFVYSFPKDVQSKFFEFCFADEDYLKSNINKVGPVPAKEALALAGFEVEDANKNLYSQRVGIYQYNRYEIKIKDDVIKSVKKPKKEMIR